MQPAEWLIPGRTACLFCDDFGRMRIDLQKWAEAAFSLVCLAVTAGILASGARRDLAADENAQRPLVVAVPLQCESINPITARYLQRAIERGEREGAECIVILLDTPGGLVDSTRSIINGIVNSRVCVVMYVSPQGARAARAGAPQVSSSCHPCGVFPCGPWVRSSRTERAPGASARGSLEAWCRGSFSPRRIRALGRHPVRRWW
jgi:hypothetical protein